jgi:hypothetical protein
VRVSAFAAGFWLFAAAVSTASSSAHAQAQPAPTMQQKLAAAQKFKEGERAFKANDYRAAASAFEAAYAIAPHPDVLLNAIDARERAGENAAAAALCDRLDRDFPTPKVKTETAAVLARLLPRVGRVDVALGEGAVDPALDGRRIEAGISYVDPGDHVVTATVRGVYFERRLRIVAGARESVRVEEAPAQPAPPPPPKKDEDASLLHPAVFFSAAGVTTLSGALLVWSGVDTNAARDAFDESPTREGLDEGRAKQVRTNVFVGTTIALGLGTAAIGIFATDWLELGGDEATPAARAALRVGPGALAIEGTFR